MAKILEAGKNGDIMPAIPEMADRVGPVRQGRVGDGRRRATRPTVAAAAKAIAGQIK